MRPWLLLVALGCGESVTFEEPPPEPVQADAVEDEPAEAYDPVTVPEDGRPDYVPASQGKEGSNGAAPVNRDVWPPVVIPQDAREREWKWDLPDGGGAGRIRVRSGQLEGIEDHVRVETAEDRPPPRPR